MPKRTDEQRLADLEAKAEAIRRKAARKAALENDPMKTDCEKARRACVRVMEGVGDGDALAQALRIAVKALEAEIERDL